MRYLWFSLLLLIPCAPATAADTSQRPPCTAQNESRFWPDEANGNPKFVTALLPYGYPEVCTIRNGHYAWRSLTVSVQKLRQDASQKRPVPAKSNATKRVTPEN